ncbi:flagellar hook capping FlgD N-terminal domain-containing protein [Loktanella sp. Alg231-35]|uniref:flagellar hook capping FlgD N-terminal domain-containing protein n=1 Tax=Loktanella sp. Alg231-35 TaxID=1922220 RepID=UPI000D560663|nr:flagellar hook capping FlgD N-terminal domain-containing protein [Loktanella sp. Alg231-35]
MDIPTTTTASSAPTSPASATATQISSDFEMFLQMLTAQMQYQDPLNPIDSTDYATQLATFSGVEQAVQTNDLLRALTEQMGVSGLAEMAGLVGKQARTSAPTYFDGQPLTLHPQPSTIGDSQEIVVTDDAGNEVQRLPVNAGEDTITWAGVGPGGEPMAAGSYTFEIVTLSQGQVIAEDPVETYGQITEVRVEDGANVLVLQGGATVPSSVVTAVRDGAV